MRVIVGAIEQALLLQRFDHARRNVERAHAAERAKVFDEHTVLVNRRDNRQAKFFAEIKVFRATTWRDVNKSRPFDFAHIFPQDDAMRLHRVFCGARDVIL